MWCKIYRGGGARFGQNNKRGSLFSAPKRSFTIFTLQIILNNLFIPKYVVLHVKISSAGFHQHNGADINIVKGSFLLQEF